MDIKQYLKEVDQLYRNGTATEHSYRGYRFCLRPQDVIYFRTGEQEEVIVKKVGVTTIDYVRYG